MNGTNSAAHTMEALQHGDFSSGCVDRQSRQTSSPSVNRPVSSVPHFAQPSV